MAEEIEKQQSVGTDLPAPTITIENCKALIEKLYSVKGDAVVSSAELYAILGPKGTVSPKISACGYYGFTDNNPSGRGYRITDFGVSVIRPEFTDESYIKKKLLEAFNKPELYKKLIDRYNSKGLPNQLGLTNILVTDYGLNKNSTAPKAAAVFLENCNLLGLNNGGRLSFFMPNINTPDGAGKKPPEGNDNGFTPPTPPDNTSFRLPIDLGEKTAFLEYPKDITLDEIGELKIMVDAAISALELRKKRIKNPADVQG